MKRYAIVRVDRKCPDEFEKIDVLYTCRLTDCSNGESCENVLYGDTKEQLVRKITTAQKRAIAKHRSEVMTYEKMAEEIVEFLGVEK